MALAIDIWINERLVFPENVYEVVISDFSEQIQFNRFQNKEEHGLRVSFTIMEGAYRGALIFQFYTPKLSPKSNLNKLCTAARGRQWTPEELASIKTIDDVKRFILNLPIRLVVRNSRSAGGRDYYAVNGYMKSTKIYQNVMAEISQYQEEFNYKQKLKKDQREGIQPPPPAPPQQTFINETNSQPEIAKPSSVLEDFDWTTPTPQTQEAPQQEPISSSIPDAQPR